MQVIWIECGQMRDWRFATTWRTETTTFVDAPCGGEGLVEAAHTPKAA
jgi:hypothetical protein